MDKQQLHDVLIKAAEDVQQGMWCQGSWFVSRCEDNDLAYAAEEAIGLQMSVETLQKLHRCAEGSIALSIVMAGLNEDDYKATVDAVAEALPDHCDTCNRYDSIPGADHPLYQHNDDHMDGMSAFDAGQHLSEIFRSTADAVL